MREILFRGKVAGGDWVYGFPFINEEEGITRSCEKEWRFPVHYILENENKIGMRRHVVILETISQYIGMNDIKGNKIFEGDVVKAKDLYQELFVIEYGDYSFGLHDGKNGVVGEWVDYDELEIIGNIFDNPELLGVKLYR